MSADLRSTNSCVRVFSASSKTSQMCLIFSGSSKINLIAAVALSLLMGRKRFCRVKCFSFQSSSEMSPQSLVTWRYPLILLQGMGH